MQFIKQILIILTFIIITIGYHQTTAADDFFYDSKNETIGGKDSSISDTSDTRSIVKEYLAPKANNKDNLSREILYKGLNIKTSETDNKVATNYIATVINYFLGLVSFVALVVLIYGFYLMFTTDNHDDAMKKAKTYLFGAILALVVMGISWFIISWAFDVFLSHK